MKKIYTYADKYGSRLYTRTAFRDTDGSVVRRAEAFSDYPFELFVPASSRAEPDSLSLYNQPLSRIEFNDVKSMSEFSDDKEGWEIHGMEDPTIQWIAKEFKGDLEPDTSLFSIFNVDIEVAHDDGFPEPSKAEDEVLSITFKRFGQTAITLGVKESKRSGYLLCADEKHLLLSFIELWEREYPDFVTGWNCIPVSQSIWLNDRIIKACDIKDNSSLFGRELNLILPRSIKRERKIILSNGHKIISSEDHIFPVAIPKFKYIDPRKFNRIEKDLASKDIEEGSYVSMQLRNNQASSLTWRKFLSRNLETYVAKGGNAIIRNESITRRMSRVKGIPLNQHTARNEWSIQEVLKFLGNDVVYDFLETSTSITLFYDGVSKSNIKVNLDEVIPNDFLWFVGLFYTDGTSSYKTEVSICNKDEGIIKKASSVISKVSRAKWLKAKDGCSYLSLGLGHWWLMKLFTHESIRSSKKSLNLEFLSQLSEEQFLNFYAGCIDGDGSVDSNGRVELCNYNKDIEKFAELLLFNGVFFTRNENCVRSYFSKHLPLAHSSKSSKFKTGSFERFEKSNDLRWIFEGDRVWVKVKGFEEGDEVEMMDISTSDNYFVTAGALTHNCSNFDITYLVNRIRKLFDEKTVRRLSPFSKKAKEVIFLREDYLGEPYYKILGITVVDYLELYKKFSPNKQESYRLDYIAQVELGEGKIDYSEYGGSLMRLYRGDVSPPKDGEEPSIPQRWLKLAEKARKEISRRKV